MPSVATSTIKTKRSTKTLKRGLCRATRACHLHKAPTGKPDEHEGEKQGHGDSFPEAAEPEGTDRGPWGDPRLVDVQRACGGLGVWDHLSIDGREWVRQLTYLAHVAARSQKIGDSRHDGELLSLILYLAGPTLAGSGPTSSAKRACAQPARTAPSASSKRDCDCYLGVFSPARQLSPISCR